MDTADAVRSNSFFTDSAGEDSVTSGDATGIMCLPSHDCACQYRYLVNVAAMSKADMTIRGQIECGSQYHFTMETQAALVVPTEGHTYSVYSSTQWVGYVQAAVANVLGIPSSRYVCIGPWLLTCGACMHACLSGRSVDVSVRRVGGGYGSKITRPNLIAAACALGAQITRR